MFISTSTFLCFYVFVLSWLNIIRERSNYHNSILKSMSSEVLSLVLIVYTFIAVWFVGGLTVFHTYLMSTNQVTSFVLLLLFILQSFILYVSLPPAYLKFRNLHLWPRLSNLHISTQRSNLMQDKDQPVFP